MAAEWRPGPTASAPSPSFPMATPQEPFSGAKTKISRSESGGGGNSTADLLGLDPTSPTSNGGGMASWTDGLGSISSVPNGNTSGAVLRGKDEDLKKLVVKQNGVLFENEVLQIGVKMEVRQNLARLGMFYGNKTQLPLSFFTPVVQGDGGGELAIQAKPVDTTLDSGAQVQQLINIECLSDYDTLPELALSFTHSNRPYHILLSLPIFLNKFFEPTQMPGDQFFARWKALSQPSQESQKIFNCKSSMDTEAVKAKLVGFGMQLLLNVDPNPDNFVSAGILHTKASQIGCLLRLEPNKSAQMYRLTMRSSRGSTAKQLVALLADLL